MAASVNCLLLLWGPRHLLILSIKTFFLLCLGEQGAPLSAFTISSKTFCNREVDMKGIFGLIEHYNQWTICKTACVQPVWYNNLATVIFIKFKKS